ncbi:MAG: nucleotidyltransferase domain-containing protein [Lachnospiraceae bacterium]|nr:nucleotidyltransferase domain-containing protein [Lachnospiraceae bacterium]
MCKLVSIETNFGENVEVADVKANTVRQIIEIATSCEQIDYIILFGSSVEETCTEESDIDIAIVSNVTKSRLFKSKEYDKFTTSLYDINSQQEYDILQFNSLKKIESSKEYVCKDIVHKGKIIYKREVC